MARFIFTRFANHLLRVIESLAQKDISVASIALIFFQNGVEDFVEINGLHELISLAGGNLRVRGAISLHCPTDEQQTQRETKDKLFLLRQKFHAHILDGFCSGHKQTRAKFLVANVWSSFGNRLFSFLRRKGIVGIVTKTRKVVLGVTGSIAAHKAVDLASELTKEKCDVRVVMTADALHFISTLPFKTLSRNPVVTDLYDEEEGWRPTHIKLADEADLLLIAPATANTLAKLAQGLADDALSCIALALNPKAKLLVAPAMNGKMWAHPATQQNVATLKSRGAEILGPADGLLSCGYEGIGRLVPVEEIVQRVLKLLS